MDPERVVAWGSSFGGGHVIVTASRDSRIAAVVAQCPFTDGLASTRAMPVATSARLTALAVRDQLSALLDREPVMVASYGPPGSTALMNAPGSAPGVQALIPEGLDVPGDVAARFVLQIARYFSGRSARRVTCPILFCISEHDTVAPSAWTERYAETAPRGEMALQPTGHFDIYVEPHFERNVRDQLDFLERHVPVADDASRIRSV